MCYAQFGIWYFFTEYIFAAVLGLYMDEEAQSLPNINSDEVLICSSRTTSEEVYINSVPVTNKTDNLIRQAD